VRGIISPKEWPCSGSGDSGRVVDYYRSAIQNGVRGDCNAKRHSPAPSFPPTGLLATPHIYSSSFQCRVEEASLSTNSKESHYAPLRYTQADASR